MNFDESKKTDFQSLENRIDIKIQKLESLISQLKSLFERVEKLEKIIQQFDTTTIIKKQPVVYLDKQGKIKTLTEDDK